MKRGLAIGLLIGLSFAAGTTWAQTQQPAPQPTRYLVANWSAGHQSESLWWVEPDEQTECYIFRHVYSPTFDGIGVGGGISCLRKAQP